MAQWRAIVNTSGRRFCKPPMIEFLQQLH